MKSWLIASAVLAVTAGSAPGRPGLRRQESHGR